MPQVLEQTINDNIRYDECGLNISNSVTLAELKQTLLSLSFTEKNHAYYIGDILLHLSKSKDKNWRDKSNEEREKEGIYKTFLEQNKHSRGNLEKYVKVCRAFNKAERQRFNRKLSFNHFYEAITLTKEKATALELLDHAASNDLSLSQTRAYYRGEALASDDEPEIDVSPVVELCNLANELGRKLATTQLTDDESAYLLKALSPVLEWTKGKGK